MNGEKYLSQILMLVPPTADEHVVTLGVVRDMIEGHLKDPVRAATTANLAATYDGTAKTLTALAFGALAVDGVTLSAGERVLVKDQTDKTQNGIYAVTVTGDVSTAFVLTRASDFDRSEELLSGVHINVAGGVSNKGTWELSSPAPLTLDSSNLEFARVTAPDKAVKAVFDISGDGSTSVFGFSHSWGTKDVVHTLYDASTDEEVVAEFRRTSVNDVEVTFGVAPAAGQNYRLALMTVISNL
jgi:hypothetical protein